MLSAVCVISNSLFTTFKWFTEYAMFKRTCNRLYQRKHSSLPCLHVSCDLVGVFLFMWKGTIALWAYPGSLLILWDSSEKVSLTAIPKDPVLLCFPPLEAWVPPYGSTTVAYKRLVFSCPSSGRLRIVK